VHFFLPGDVAEFIEHSEKGFAFEIMAAGDDEDLTRLEMTSGSAA